MPFKDSLQGQTQYLDENGKFVGEIKSYQDSSLLSYVPPVEGEILDHQRLIEIRLDDERYDQLWFYCDTCDCDRLISYKEEIYKSLINGVTTTDDFSSYFFGHEGHEVELITKPHHLKTCVQSEKEKNKK